MALLFLAWTDISLKCEPFVTWSLCDQESCYTLLLNGFPEHLNKFSSCFTTGGQFFFTVLHIQVKNSTMFHILKWVCVPNNSCYFLFCSKLWQISTLCSVILYQETWLIFVCLLLWHVLFRTTDSLLLDMFYFLCWEKTIQIDTSLCLMCLKSFFHLNLKYDSY